MKINLKHLIIFYLLSLLIYSCSSTSVNNPEMEDILLNMPKINPFMIQSDSISYANWLNRKLPNGKNIIEPINLILIDKNSTNKDSAINKLHAIMTRIGFKSRYGHTGGYLGEMDKILFEQQPSQKDMAFSDFMWIFSNNHVRIFGPYTKSKYNYWIASVSREKGISHNYISFSNARDTLVKYLTLHSNAINLGPYDLKNKIDDANTSSGDHDGKAIIILY